MRPFEADCYADGWRVCVMGGLRSENPYKRPYGSAWDSYRRNAWDKGWFDCYRKAAWVDPRKNRVEVAL